MKQKRGLSLQSRRAVSGYLFTLPFLIGFVLFFLSPFVFYITMAFSDMSMTNTGMAFTFSGLKNYVHIFTTNTEFIGQVFDGLKSILIRLPSVVFFSFFVSIMLNQKFRGRGLARAIFFLPVVTASGIAAVSGNEYGIMDTAQMILQGNLEGNSEVSVNITQSVVALFGTSSYGSALVDFTVGIISGIYSIANASGVQILIFLAGLQTISPSLYEASHMDGATSWENFWKITLPMISPLILVNAVYTVVDCLAGADNSVIDNIYTTAMQKIQYTTSAAMGLLYFTLIFLIIGVIIWVLSKLVFYED